MKNTIVSALCCLLLVSGASAQVFKSKKKQSSNHDAVALNNASKPVTHNDSLMCFVLAKLDSIVATGRLPDGWIAYGGDCPHSYGYSPSFGWPYQYQLQWLCPEKEQAKAEKRSEFQVISMSKTLAPYLVVFWLYPDTSSRSAQLTVGGSGSWSVYTFALGCWSAELNADATEVLRQLYEYSQNTR